MQCISHNRPVPFIFLQIALFLIFVFSSLTVVAEPGVSAVNAHQAREMFNKIYQKTFGAQGCRMSYSVNIIGLYKTNGRERKYIMPSRAIVRGVTEFAFTA